MNKYLTTATITAIAASLWVVTPASAESCTTVDFQGAPADICPSLTPDPTNCYTGWYQGAPIEICMPTGATLPEDSTYHDGTPWAGQPVVIHNSGISVASPATEPAPTSAAPQTMEMPEATAVSVEWPKWLIQLNTLLVANGGF